MTQIFYDCKGEFVMLYIDTHLIFSKDKQSHYRILETVISSRPENELYTSSIKCKYSKKIYILSSRSHWRKWHRDEFKQVEDIMFVARAFIDLCHS